MRLKKEEYLAIDDNDKDDKKTRKYSFRLSHKDSDASADVRFVKAFDDIVNRKRFFLAIIMFFIFFPPNLKKVTR